MTESDARRDSGIDTGIDTEIDTEMNTGVSDSDLPSPQQTGSLYSTDETAPVTEPAVGRAGDADRLDTEATDATVDADMATEMNTGVSDHDVPSPQQSDSLYSTDETAPVTEPGSRSD